VTTPNVGAGGPTGSVPAGMSGAGAPAGARPVSGQAASGAAAGGRPAAGRTGSAVRKPARPAAASSTAKRTKPVRPPRLASLQLRRIDPWTALKVSLIVSIVMFFVWMIAIGVLYLSLDALGVWARINETYNTLIVSGDSVQIQPDLITPGTVFGVTAVVGAVNIVLFTALSAVAAFVYNAAAGMAGGVELTLGERD
jgi:hypothetical protein